MNKILAGITAVVLAGGSAYGYKTYLSSSESAPVSEIIKEVTVAKGNVTSGVTESAAVSVESLEQKYDLVLNSTSVSASVESSGSGSPSGGMNMGGIPGSGGSGSSKSGGSFGSTSVSTKSESSALSLVVDKVNITEGQIVKKGDVLMTITQESIDEARALLTKAVDDAELALKQAQIEETETKLSAKYEYDKRIAYGSSAYTVYSSALNDIAQNINDICDKINDINSQIDELNEEAEDADDEQKEIIEEKKSQLNTQLETLNSQLTSACNSRASEELAAKQTYEEACMYYNNAQSLYDVSVNGVGSSSEEAQETLDTAKADLETFEAYISDGSIRAEYSGTVTGVGYAPGDTLNSDTAIASFADAESITITVNVTEDDIAAVGIGDEVDISFIAYPDEEYSGYVSEIGSSSSSGNNSTVSYPVTVVVTSVPDTLLSGMTANVTFITKKVSDVLYVSNKAVTNEGTESYVLKKTDDGGEEQIKVEVGFSNGSVAEIKGVSEGDTLLIKGKVS